MSNLIVGVLRRRRRGESMFRPLEAGGDEVLGAGRHFASAQPEQLVTYDGCFDELVTDASARLAKGLAFEAMELHTVLTRFMDVCDELIIWYSHFFEDLEEVTGRKNLLSLVEAQTRTEHAEIYCRYTAA